MKFDFSYFKSANVLEQMLAAWQVLLDTPAFIKRHQLWQGFLDHKWIMIVTILIMGKLSVTLYNDLHNYFDPPAIEVAIDIPTEEMEESIKALEAAALNSPEDVKERLEAEKRSLMEKKEKLEENHKPLFSGSYKFLILIFLEILIFHFSVGTNNILKGKNRILTIKEFYLAQIRMVLVMGHKWIYGLLMYILVSVVCGLLSISYLTDFIMFFVYSFFLGFAFLDNYLEQFHLTIQESSKHIQSHYGAAVVLGIFASIGMSIPVIGPILIPFICAVAATIYGHEAQMEKEVIVA